MPVPKPYDMPGSGFEGNGHTHPSLHHRRNGTGAELTFCSLCLGLFGGLCPRVTFSGVKQVAIASVTSVLLYKFGSETVYVI